MTSVVDTPEFEAARRQFYAADGTFSHVRMRPTYEKALSQQFITPGEFAEPSEDGRALDRMITLASVASGMLDDATLPTADPKALSTTLLNRLEHNSSYASLLGEAMRQMVATPATPPHTIQSARHFILTELLPAVITDRQRDLKAIADGEIYYQREIAEDPARIQPFVSDKTAVAEVSARLAATGEPVEFHGAFQGSYTVGSTDGGKANPPLIGTDFLMDCVAVVLHGVDPNDPKKQTSVIGHIDISTNPRQAVEDMLAHVPAGYRIDATLLGGPQAENPYMNTQVLNALRTNDRVGPIRQDTNAATTVLVDVQTGTILHHAGRESEGSAESIRDGEFPFRVKPGGFPKHDIKNLDDDRHEFREFVERGMDPSVPINPWMPLVNARNSDDKAHQEANSISGLINNSVNDALLTSDEQRAILERAREVFKMNDVTLDISDGNLQLMHGNTKLLSVLAPQDLKVEGKSSPAH